MKKYTPHLIILVILALVSIYLLRTREKGTFRPGDSGFAVADTARVSHIEINRSGESVILARQASTWRVNTVFKAHPERIKALMMLLSRLEVTAPVPKSLRERMIAASVLRIKR